MSLFSASKKDIEYDRNILLAQTKCLLIQDLGTYT